ncbi:MAG: hypothetical protein AB1899_05650 [Pseudomonadota bacterium]
MKLIVRVISQHPPGGRCTLYAGYADVLARHLQFSAELDFSASRDAHGSGFPSLLLDGVPVLPADGVILMPSDILAALTGLGISDEDRPGLAEALEVPLERMLEETA